MVLRHRCLVLVVGRNDQAMEKTELLVAYQVDIFYPRGSSAFLSMDAR